MAGQLKVKQQRQLKADYTHHIRNNMEGSTDSPVVRGRSSTMACGRPGVSAQSSTQPWRRCPTSSQCPRLTAPALKSTASWNDACSNQRPRRRRPERCTLSTGLPRQLGDHRSSYISLRRRLDVDNEPLHRWLLGAGSIHSSTSRGFSQLDNVDRKILQDVWFSRQ